MLKGKTTLVTGSTSGVGAGSSSRTANSAAAASDNATSPTHAVQPKPPQRRCWAVRLELPAMATAG
jgi:NAD(P)-dependent dehydrogenase (short-subunit alcohol dehydrogenase family)